jgi:hypothetical protein
MKGSKSLLAITIAVTLAITPSASAAPKTTLKAAGRDATTVVNTILSGAAIPTKGVGIDGDFYIDTKNANLYGPKIKGVWKIATTLKQAEIKSVTTVVGEQGGIGATGAQGDKGDKGATGNTGANGSAGLTGASGATGAVGAKGNDGATGATGFSGATGATGLIGATGPAGPTGATGLKGDTGLTGVAGAAGAAGAAGSNGTNGVDGAPGTAGAKGDTGLTGLTGSKGDTGTAGAAGSNGTNGSPGAAGVDGVSISYFVNTGTWILTSGTSMGAIDSDPFGSLPAGTYTFEIMVDGTFSSVFTGPASIGMQLVASNGTPDYRVFASDTTAYINGAGSRHIQFLIIGKLVCTGTSTLRLHSIDQNGSTGSVLLNFSGRALINKVGSIG